MYFEVCLFLKKCNSTSCNVFAAVRVASFRLLWLTFVCHVCVAMVIALCVCVCCARAYTGTLKLSSKILLAASPRSGGSFRLAPSLPCTAAAATVCSFENEVALVQAS
jgi:hypothetical protein